MNNYTFKFEDIKKNYRESIDKAYKERQADVEQAKTELLQNPTDENAKTYSWRITSLNYFYNHYMDGPEMNRMIAELRDGYNLFDNMARTLSYQYNARVEDDKIYIKGIGTLSFTAELFSKYFGYKSGMFTFSSSFTSHQAFSEKGYEFRITCGEADEVVFEFGLKKCADSADAFKYYC